MTDAVTLPDHVRAHGGPEAASLVVVLAQLASAGRAIAGELGRAALVGQLGTTGDTNVQGETVKKLDVWANDVVLAALTESGLVCTLVSEEMPDARHLDDRCGEARYVVSFDPVDGSSNLDVNGIVGTIFSMRPRSGGPRHVETDPLGAGTGQVAAGYIMYGPATVMVVTVGDGVDGFTLDPRTGEFTLSHRSIRIPARGRTYSVNEGNTSRWPPSMQRYVEHLRSPEPADGRPYGARYVGSLVADVHRTLLDGGVFLYPGDASGSRADGKLRLLYEAAPMGFIVEQAGGKASTGTRRILDIEASGLHQRVPLIIGSRDDVTRAEDFMGGRRT